MNYASCAVSPFTLSDIQTDPNDFARFVGALTGSVANFIQGDYLDGTEPLILEATEVSVARASRMDLFVGIGLPVLVAAGVLVGGAWLMYTRLDDKIDKQVESFDGNLKTLEATMRSEMSEDRKLLASQFEVMRSEMRQDRTETTNRYLELLHKVREISSSPN